ncbi:MAG TPA: methyltransferase domain-containing protein, partial [Chloroflexaceae bacterium]|nr:methyltransferase domain-containing protein [Chloroflexaceae bacterium]
DAGCGAGAATGWLPTEVGPAGLAVGLDLSAAHARLARAAAPAATGVVQADLAAAPLRPGSLDLVWCVNTINHLRDPLAGARRLAELLRPGGRLALGQSHLLPEMVFAWDARLERAVTEANRAYYRARYGLDERDTAAIRALVGLLRAAGLRDVRARTVAIERVAPLAAADEAYLGEALLRGYWGEPVRASLDPADRAELERLADPAGPGYCLRRPDFHYVQTFTLVTGVL